MNYTAVGLGLGKITLPRDRLPSLENGGIKLAHPLPFLPTQINPQSVVWVFPLEQGALPRFLLLIVEDRYSLFRPQFIDRILPHIRDRFVYPEEGSRAEAEPKPAEQEPEAAQEPEPVAKQEATAQEPTVQEAERAEQESVAQEPTAKPKPTVQESVEPEPDIKARITRYGEGQKRLSGIVFEKPPDAGPAGLELELSGMASPFALTIGLPSGRSLLLFPPSIDSGLVAHRISRTLKTAALCVFEEKDLPGVFEALDPYFLPSPHPLPQS